MAGEAFNFNNVTLLEFVAEPLGRGHGPCFLVVAHIVNAGDGQFLVDRNDEDTSLDGFSECGIQTGGVARIDEDGVHFFAHQVLQLLNLSSDIGVGGFNDQVIGHAGFHIFGIGVLELLDHLGAVFAADEGIGDTNGDFFGGRCFSRCGCGRHGSGGGHGGGCGCRRGSGCSGGCRCRRGSRCRGCSWGTGSNG